MAPFFTIGVTTHDREEMLQETLNSILDQTFGDYEVIVSNDNPQRKISGRYAGIYDSRFKFIDQEANRGEISNMNYLLEKSSGRYFTWIADDDLYLPEFLNSAYQALIKYAFPRCVFTSYQVFREEIPAISLDNFNHKVGLFSGDEFLYRYNKGKLKAFSSMGLFESKTLKEIGCMEDISGDGNGMFAEHMLFVKSGLLDRIAYINMPLILFRWHKGSWSYKNFDLDMYLRAADNLTRQCIEIFKSSLLKKHFYTHLYSVLYLPINYTLMIMSKRKSLGDRSVKKIIVYLIYAKRYIDSLKGSRLYLIGLIALIHVEINIALCFIARNIRKKFWRNPLEIPFKLPEEI